MDHTLRSLTALALAGLAAACGAGNDGAAASKGNVKFTFDTKPRSLTLSLPAICADFTLTPYSIDANGAHQPAGAPITISETTPGATAFIAGCIDGAPAVSGNDWGYAVTATNWHLCNPNAPLDAGLQAYLAQHGLTMAQFIATFSPQTATSAFDFDCKAGYDVPAPISVNVTVPVESSAGYVDISLDVNVHEVEIGCKKADVDPNNAALINFGSSFAGPRKDGVVFPDGAVAGDAQQLVHQWASFNTQGQMGYQFYTGQAAMPSGVNADGTPATTTLTQTFFTPCATGEYVNSHQPICNTVATAAIPEDQFHAGTPASVNTTASLADAFVASAAGMAWATVANGVITIHTTLTSATIPPNTSPQAVSAYNVVLPAQAIPVPAPYAVVSVAPSGQAPFAFVVVVQDASGAQFWVTLVWDATAQQWVGKNPPGVKPVAGLTADQIQCLNLFGTAQGCLTPKTCVQDKLCNDSVWKETLGALFNACAGTLPPGGYPTTSVYCDNMACADAWIRYLQTSVNSAVTCADLMSYAAFQRNGCHP